MKRIAVATFGRSDYSNCLPILRAIKADPALELRLIVSGMHLSPEFGLTAGQIEADGFAIDDRIEMLLSSDSPEGAAKAIGLGTLGFAQCFARSRPDVLLLLGDRFELLAPACASVPFQIPLAHAFGGDVTEGAVDNQVRHAVTKLSHIHFVAMESHKERLLQMGEEPWRVFVAGDPALDLIPRLELLGRPELEESLGLPLKPPVLVVTFHPTTLGGAAGDEADALLSALARVQGTLIFTYPNADPGGRAIAERLKAFAKDRPHVKLFFDLGYRRYYSLLAQADLMVGNSSSGLWESPAFRLPVVNVGDRQRGRVRAENVIDVPPEAEAVSRAVARGLDPAFRASWGELKNPYGKGRSAEAIVEQLKALEPGPRLLQKSFRTAPAS